MTHSNILCQHLIPTWQSWNQPLRLVWFYANSSVRFEGYTHEYYAELADRRHSPYFCNYAYPNFAARLYTQQ
jgi:hypothetical protein